MSRKVELLELDISTENLLKNGAKAQKEIERLKEESNFLKKAIQEGNKTIDVNREKLALLEKQGKQNSTEYINLKKNLDVFTNSQEKNRQKLELVKNALSQQNQEYRNNQRAITDFNKAVESELGIITQTDGSINQLNRALANNRKIYRELTEEQRENTEIGGKLFKVIAEQDAKYKDLQSSIGTTQVRVGDYKEQIKQALSESSGFSAQLDAQIGQIPVVGTQLGAVVKVTRGYAQAKLLSAKATDTGTRSLKAFRLALIGTGIGAILVLLGSLIAYFSSTQKGIDKVNKVLTPLKVVLQSMWGVLQNLGETFVDAFNSPQKYIDKLWQKTENYRKLLVGLFTLNPKKISEGFNGVVDDIKNIAKNTGEFFDEAWQRGKRIEEIQQQLNKGEADYILNLAKAKEEFKANNKIAEDQSKTLAEREKAVLKSIDNQKEINRLENERLDLQIEQMKLEQESNDTSDAERAELAKLIAQRNESRTRQLEAETTQQNKLNTIRKEAYNKAIELAKKRVDEAIKESKTLINIYIQEQGIKAKTLEEELELAKTISEKKKNILKQELDAKKITQSEYKLAILEIDNELAQKQRDVIVDNANRELEIFKGTHQAKLDANTFFTEELLKQEIERLDLIAQKEREYHQKRLEQGVINQIEYNDAIKAVDEENRIKKEEAEILREEARKEKEAIDLENQRLIEEERFQNQFEIQLSRLDQQYQSEIKKAEKTGADTTLITKKYELTKAKIQDAARETKLNADGRAFGQIADFIGQEHALGKAAALAQSAINIQQGITKALSSKGFAGIAEGVLIAAKGAVSIGKIAGVSPPKAEQGATFTIGGKRHSQGGTKFYGEDGTAFEAEKDERMFILNRKASAMLGPILSDINQQYGGVALSNASSYLQSGGEVLRGITIPNISTTQKLDTSGIKEAIYQGSKDGISSTKIVVAVEDINTGQSNYAEVVNRANI